MSDSNKKILLVLLGILFIAGAVFLVARPKNEKIKGLKAEIYVRKKNIRMNIYRI